MSLDPGILSTLAATSPLERFEAMRRWPALSLSIDWAVWGPVVGGLAVATVLFLLYRRRRAERLRIRRFFETGEKLGLSKGEQAVLMSVANLAGTRRYSDVYFVEEVFIRGAEAMRQSKAVAAMDERTRKKLDAALRALRRKLGMGQEGAEEEASGVGSVLKKGDTVTLSRKGEARGVQASVASAKQREIVLVTADAKPWRVGEACVVRQVYEGLHYELDVSVSAVNDRLVMLRLVGDPRYVNMRRFVRVPLDCPAYVARYPFSEEDGQEPGPPEFVSGRLTEMGGPGFRVAVPLEVQVGDRVLTVARTGADRTVRGVGEVRRVVRGKERVDLALELTGLNEEEVGRLVRDTNTVVRQNRGDAGETEPAAETGQ